MDFARVQSRVALLALGCLTLATVLVGGCAAPSDSDKAGNFATVVGTVVDEQGNPVPGAVVTVESGIAFQANPVIDGQSVATTNGQVAISNVGPVTTNAAGQFVLTGTQVTNPPAVLNLRVSAPGFVSVLVPGVVINATTVPVNVTLPRSGVNFTAAGVPFVGQTTVPAGTSQVLNAQALVNGQPVVGITTFTVLSGQNVVSLVGVPGQTNAVTMSALAPGTATIQAVTTTATGQRFTTVFQVIVAQAGVPSVGFTVNGQSADNAITVNTLGTPFTLGVQAFANGVPVTVNSVLYRLVSGQDVVTLTQVAGANTATVKPVAFGTAVVEAVVNAGGQTQTVSFVINAVHPQGHFQGGGSGS